MVVAIGVDIRGDVLAVIGHKSSSRSSNSNRHIYISSSSNNQRGSSSKKHIAVVAAIDIRLVRGVEASIGLIVVGIAAMSSSISCNMRGSIWRSSNNSKKHNSGGVATVIGIGVDVRVIALIVEVWGVKLLGLRRRSSNRIRLRRSWSNSNSRSRS